MGRALITCKLNGQTDPPFCQAAPAQRLNEAALIFKGFFFFAPLSLTAEINKHGNLIKPLRHNRLAPEAAFAAWDVEEGNIKTKRLRNRLSQAGSLMPRLGRRAGTGAVVNNETANRN